MSPRKNDCAPENGHSEKPAATPERESGTVPAPGPQNGEHGRTPSSTRDGALGTEPHAGPRSAQPDGDRPTATAATATSDGALGAGPGPESGSERPTATATAGGADPESGEADPESGEAEPESGGADPESGEADPESGEADPESGGAEPSVVGEEAEAQRAAAQPAGAATVEQRVAAVRRVGAAGRRWRAWQLAGSAVLLAVALTAGAIAVGAARDGGKASAAAASSAVSPELSASGNLDASIASLQAHLQGQPKDYGGWATLGLAYVEQARTKGDPSRYPQAEKALARSLELAPDNDQALAGRAALAAARHDFHGALTYADKALKQNPYSERALSSRIDALVELGRYDEASKAADTADARRPGVPVFTRYAYVHELRGDVTTARRVLAHALATATSPGDIAYIAAQLGQLAWNQGDYKTALTDYARALAADENYLPALEGRARAQAASGDRAGAIKGMEEVVSRCPLPGPLVVLGELYEARGADGDKARAGDQYALVDAWIALARANGVNADLDTALAAADHGNAGSALRAARAEWARRHTVHTADALAWALHVNGLDPEALPYARRATATGYRNAAFLYHRGMIERATGRIDDARTHLTAALKLNPGFSPLGAREARTALKALEAAK
ncbi:tetratricopeptide repeat protein [Streptomyces sp. NPDC005202]|uniref:tetratricopeptide repeat protein n=1 Tax=Streptomyces sp. NPDC005202 TaxID=3157021 RepID=UPI0033BF3812